MNGKLIILEAGDGSGKATQSRMLYERLAADGYPVRKVEYPNYASDSSALIKMYLDGRFGSKPEDVNAYAASTFYAVDRFASYKTDWESFYQDGGIIVADRYTTSNMVHQAVKLTDATEREAYLDWLWDLEFGKMGLPVPDQVIFLDMPPAYSQALRQERSSQTGVAADIHEQDEAYLRHCYNNYLALAEKYGWQRIDCVDAAGLRSMEAIHADVLRAVRTVLASD